MRVIRIVLCLPRDPSNGHLGTPNVKEKSETGTFVHKLHVCVSQQSGWCTLLLIPSCGLYVMSNKWQSSKKEENSSIVT